MAHYTSPSFITVNYINCNIIENLINKELDVKSLVPFIITEYANSLTNTWGM